MTRVRAQSSTNLAAEEITRWLEGGTKSERGVLNIAREGAISYSSIDEVSRMPLGPLNLPNSIPYTTSPNHGQEAIIFIL